MNSSLLVKLFIGYKLTSEMAMYLKESKAWQQILVSPVQERDLLITHFEQKDYLGRFAQSPFYSLKELQKIEEDIKESLNGYCPKLNLDKLICCIFPQVFIP